MPPRGRRQYGYPYRVSSYVQLKRTWRTGDTVEISLPKSLGVEPLPDNPRRASVLWGPLVLAGDLGDERPRQRGEGEAVGPPPKAPVLVAAERPVAEWVQLVDGTPVRFHTDGVGREPDATGRARDVELVPFYRLHRRAYATYWDLFTGSEWEAKKAQYPPG